ncbi:uncharacterized protein LOC129945423 [Eupeodes corollae]|uniref:uncharacterized protein LOC129945423 n=1 Tax=Eupeodes corollae TaxID=290404 RepID=UPI002492D089|nr:uncharacterized protein LOC129945423 [Eupeodes corollae]
MPGSQSKISFDAINIVRAENIYLTDNKKDRNAKRKISTNDETVFEKKKLVSDSETRHTTKHKNLKFNTKDQKSKMASSLSTAGKKSRKRQWDIGNAYSKLNAQVKNPPKSNDGHPKNVLTEKIDSAISLYATPREEISIIDGIDLENMNPNHLPQHFYESELDNFIRSQYPDFEDCLEYDFQEPLNFEKYDLPPESFHPKKSNLRHFKELLEREESSQNKLLQKSEVELLRDIVKADERYQKLKRDDYQLLKEILLGQLKEISEQERVIKIALNKIRCERNQDFQVSTLKVAKAEQPLESNITKINLNKVPLATDQKSIEKKTCTPKTKAKQELDVFFKNVPTLESEIRILKLLGQKLEETLKKSTETTTIKSTPLTLLSTQCLYYKHFVTIASSMVFPMAFKSILGLVQEFKISHQTINELKLERDFYIATDLDNFTLQRTNFDLLRYNPEFLLRKLKPLTKDSRLKFNFIEQDPMFFNHFIANICNISPKTLTGTYIPENSKTINCVPAIKMNDVGDGAGDFIFKDDDLNKELPVEMENAISRTISDRNKFKQQRSRTPLQEKKFVSAKNSLLKTVLLGFLHLTLVLVVLSAIFYPDVICF